MEPPEQKLAKRSWRRGGYQGERGLRHLAAGQRALGSGEVHTRRRQGPGSPGAGPRLGGAPALAALSPRGGPRTAPPRGAGSPAAEALLGLVPAASAARAAEWEPGDAGVAAAEKSEASVQTRQHPRRVSGQRRRPARVTPRPAGPRLWSAAFAPLGTPGPGDLLRSRLRSRRRAR